MAVLTQDVPSSLAEDTRAYCRELERVIAAQPSIHTLPVAQTRRIRREGLGIWPAPVFVPEARMLEIDGPGGRLPLRLFVPEPRVTGAFLHIHGGGWVLGDHDMQDPRLLRLANETGLAVLSVGYRLAPEHPYPAAPDDCEAAALWLLEHRDELGIEPGLPLAIGGDSAGGHLAATTLVRLRDRHDRADAFAAAVFQYGAFDLSMTPSQRLWGERNLVLSGPIIAWFGDQFLPGIDREARRDPDISPLYAELRDLPPAIFSVGTADALLDDTLFMEARWRAAGHETELRVWPEAPHGYYGFPMAITDLALRAEYAFLRRTLRLEP